MTKLCSFSTFVISTTILFFLVGCRTAPSPPAVPDEATRSADAAARWHQALNDPWLSDVPLPEAGFGYVTPLEGPVVCLQGNDGSFSHQDEFNRYAWDYAAPIGTPIYAAADGIVTARAMFSRIGGPTRANITDANQLRLRHIDGRDSLYLHLSYAADDDGPWPGEFVLAGERIGRTGMTGWTDRPHLHFAVMDGVRSVPIAFRDFDENGGVPRRGDRPGGPIACAYPQETIDAYKSAYRAARRARDLGHDDIAFRIAHAVVVSPLSSDLSAQAAAVSFPLTPDYFYHRALESYAARAEASLLLPVADRWVEARRRAYKSEEWADQSGTDRDAADRRRLFLWRAGLSAQAERQMDVAARKLIAATTDADPAMRRAVLGDARVMAEEVLARLETRTARWLDEVRRARPEEADAVRDAARDEWKRAASALTILRSGFPELAPTIDGPLRGLKPTLERIGIAGEATLSAP